MNNMKWTPAHIVALVIIVGCFVLKGMGVDDVINKILLAAASFYFGLLIPQPKEPK